MTILKTVIVKNLHLLAFSCSYIFFNGRDVKKNNLEKDAGLCNLVKNESLKQASIFRPVLTPPFVPVIIITH